MPRKKKDKELEEITQALDDKKKKARKPSKRELMMLEIAKQTILPKNYYTVWTREELNEMVEFLKDKEYIAVDTETMGVNVWKDEIVGLSLYAPNKGFYIPLKHIDHDPMGAGRIGIDYVKCLPKELVVEKIKPILTTKKLILHNAKFDMHVFRNWLGFEIEPYFDTMIAQWLLDENQPKSLKELATIYLKIEADKFSELFGKETFDKVPILLDPDTRTGNLATYYAVKDVEMTYKLFEFQSFHLERETLKELKDLFYNVEMPFLKIVYEAEKHGVKLNTDYLVNEVGAQLKKEQEELAKQIKEYVGDINLNSPKQLSKALYEDLKLPKLAPRDKPGTDSKTLKLIENVHPVISLILQYREKEKLISAFVEALPELVVDGRIHTNFQTIGTVTGRMSSSEPNLQQIPAKTGNFIRNAFEADEGRLLVSIDFSAQELRLLAHLSRDPVLLDIYKNNKDAHAMTAVAIWNMQHPEEQVDYDYFQYCREMTAYFQDADGNILEEKLNDKEYIQQLYEEGKINTTDKEKLRDQAEKGKKFEKVRKAAKSVNFGIVYGISEKGLAEQLLIPEEEAKKYIESYFQTYPIVKKWINEQHKFIMKNKYVKTMLGRKRRLYKEIESKDPIEISKALRMGVNAIIQGSAADMTKLAAIKLQPLLKELDARIVLFIHDELLFDVPANIGMENLKRIADVMANALPLDCGMKCDIEAGYKWGQKMSEGEIEALKNS